MSGVVPSFLLYAFIQGQLNLFLFCVTPSLYYLFCTCVLSHICYHPNPILTLSFSVPLKTAHTFQHPDWIPGSLLISVIPSSSHTSCLRNPHPPTVAPHIVPFTNSLSYLLMFIHKQTSSQTFHIFCVPHSCLCNFWFFLSRTSISSPNLPFVLPLIHAHNHYFTQKL